MSLEECALVDVKVPIGDADGEVAEREGCNVDATCNKTVALHRREGSIVPDDVGDRIRRRVIPLRHRTTCTTAAAESGWGLRICHSDAQSIIFSIHTFRSRVSRGRSSRSRRTRTGRPFGGGPFITMSRQRPTLPPGLPGSTIGAGGLHFRVRDGTGCFPSAIATETAFPDHSGSD